MENRAPRAMKSECRSVNRNCCLGIWNLYLVFQFPKSQGEARNLDSAWRYLDLEICPVSKIRGEARNLDSGWPEPVLGNCPVIQNPWRGAESGIWMARAAFLETRVLPKSGQPPAPRPQLNGTVCPAPPGVFEPVPLLSFFLVLETRNLGKWKLRSLYQ